MSSLSWALELKMFSAAHELREAPDPAAAAAAEQRLRAMFDALAPTRALEEKVEAFIEKTLAPAVSLAS
jgi:hypothetical protein